MKFCTKMERLKNTVKIIFFFKFIFLDGQFNYVSFEGLWDGKPLLIAGTVKEFHLAGFLIEDGNIKTLFEEQRMSKGK